MKRVFDLFFSFIVLFIFFPVIILISISILVIDGRPVIYRGERTGLRDSRFLIMKFRTMKVGQAWISGTTGPNDARVTRLGKLLRKLKLDELPQFLNVLAGDMSIVGPRPELPKFTNLYESSDKAILDVKPGITDLASLRFIDLSSHLDSEDFDRAYLRNVFRKKNRLRRFYAERNSFCFDMLIITKTIRALMKTVFKS